MPNHTRIEMPEPSDAQVKHGILAFLAHKYASAELNAAPFVASRNSNLSQIHVFLKTKMIRNCDIDRTRWDKNDRSKILNPFHTADKERIESLVDEMVREGRLEFHQDRHRSTYFITQKGAEDLKDTVLAGAFDSGIKLGSLRMMMLADADWVKVPKVTETMPERPLAFTRVDATAGNAVDARKAVIRNIKTRLDKDDQAASRE